jgi:hypothetical protein
VWRENRRPISGNDNGCIGSRVQCADFSENSHRTPLPRLNEGNRLLTRAALPDGLIPVGDGALGVCYKRVCPAYPRRVRQKFSF